MGLFWLFSVSQMSLLFLLTYIPDEAVPSLCVSFHPLCHILKYYWVVLNKNQSAFISLYPQAFCDPCYFTFTGAEFFFFLVFPWYRCRILLSWYLENWGASETVTRWSVLGSPSVASSQRWSQNQRIVWVERNLKDLPIPTPCHEHRHLPLDQVAQTFPLEHQEGTACLAGRKETPAWILDLQPKVQRWPCL